MANNELDPHNFGAVVERHIKDCEFPDSIPDRLGKFREEAMELYQAVHLEHYGEGIKTPEDVKGEMGDVLFTLFALMNDYGFSFEECVDDVLTKNMTRFNSGVREELQQEGIPSEDMYQVAKSRRGYS